ncbi:MAG: hypothetical protein KGI50_04635 [Patescibacteria group bacterium]|nr:hypothetical protein [Patescibacteria group bacterium]MDE2439254.1 hypothetical protein [Patescibacteria group bacterium]
MDSATLQRIAQRCKNELFPTLLAEFSEAIPWLHTASAAEAQMCLHDIVRNATFRYKELFPDYANPMPALVNNMLTVMIVIECNAIFPRDHCYRLAVVYIEGELSPQIGIFQRNTLNIPEDVIPIIKVSQSAVHATRDQENNFLTLPFPFSDN